MIKHVKDKWTQKMKVMIPLLFIGIIVAMENKRSDEKYSGLGKVMPWCFIALYFVLLLISSISSNVYVAACGVVPICVVFVCYKFLRLVCLSSFWTVALLP